MSFIKKKYGYAFNQVHILLCCINLYRYGLMCHKSFY